MLWIGQIPIIINTCTTIIAITIYHYHSYTTLRYIHYNTYIPLPCCCTICLYRHRETTRPFIIRHITKRCCSRHEIELAHTHTLSWAVALKKKKKIYEKIVRTHAVAAASEDRQIGGKTSCVSYVLLVHTDAAGYPEQNLSIP